MDTGNLITYGFEFGAMASACEVRVSAPDQPQARAWAQAAIDEVHRIESKYSRYRADSVVGRINAGAGAEPVDCDAETKSLFDYAQALFDASDGLFDITSGVLRRAWDFKQSRVPSQAELAPLLDLIDWRSVERHGSMLRLPRAGMEVDFGGFGKEYAADRAASVLLEAGAARGFVNLGGDLRVIGPQPDGSAWSIAIQDPRLASGVAASIPIARGGLATSGDYERFFELDGHRYCHILNPRTGRPVSGWRSVSVLAPLAIAAGSCSTIAMLKEDRALEFLEATGYEFMAIDGAGNLHRAPAA